MLSAACVWVTLMSCKMPMNRHMVDLSGKIKVERQSIRSVGGWICGIADQWSVYLMVEICCKRQPSA